MTLLELKTGMIIENALGERAMIFSNSGTIQYMSPLMQGTISEVETHLTNRDNINSNIVKIYQFKDGFSWDYLVMDKYWNDNYLELIWSKK